MILSNPRERRRFLRFAVVGIIGAVIDFGMMNLLVNLFHAPLVLAGTISFIAAILSNFTWNRLWTYPDSRSKPIGRQLAMFSVVNVAGLAIRLPILAFLEPLLTHLLERIRLPGSASISFLQPKFLSENITLAVAVIVVMFWNFYVNRYWTYNDVE